MHSPPRFEIKVRAWIDWFVHAWNTWSMHARASFVGSICVHGSVHPFLLAALVSFFIARCSVDRSLTFSRVVASPGLWDFDCFQLVSFLTFVPRLTIFVDVSALLQFARLRVYISTIVRRVTNVWTIGHMAFIFDSTYYSHFSFGTFSTCTCLSRVCFHCQSLWPLHLSFCSFIFPDRSYSWESDFSWYVGGYLFLAHKIYIIVNTCGSISFGYAGSSSFSWNGWILLIFNVSYLAPLFTDFFIVTVPLSFTFVITNGPSKADSRVGCTPAPVWLAFLFKTLSPTWYLWGTLRRFSLALFAAATSCFRFWMWYGFCWR